MSHNAGTSNGTNSVQIRCTYPGCGCEAFVTAVDNIRQCNICPHGWVPHALDKIGIVYQWDMRKYEPITFDCIFDIASLVLFGTQGLPFRLHVCMERLLACLEVDEILRIIEQFDWTWEDFYRGFKLQTPEKTLRNSWVYPTLVDETMILGHFLKYKPTQAVATRFLQDIANQKKEDNPYLQYFTVQPPESALQTFFLQNQQKHIPAASSLGTPPNAVPQQPPPVQNGSPLVLQGLNTPRPDGNGPLTPMVIRTVQNGTIHVQPESHMALPHTNQFSISLSQHPPTPTVATPPQPSIPGKRKLQPKPAAPQPVILPEKIPASPGISPVLPGQTEKKALPKLDKMTPAALDTLTGMLPKKTPTKRVDCDHCHKSFCDKGALKIHYSAVHLKEMHRCTVKGCNMMFSSRRSRNRHSSNPNPRLHSNLFQPRRGGILASGDDELPPQNDEPEPHDIDMDDDDDDRSMSYEEVDPKMDSPEDSGRGSKLIIATDEPTSGSSQSDRMETVAKRKPNFNGCFPFRTDDMFNYGPAFKPAKLQALDYSMRATSHDEPVDLVKNGRSLDDKDYSLHIPKERRTLDSPKRFTDLERLESDPGIGHRGDDSDDDDSCSLSESAMDSLSTPPLSVQRDEHGKVIVPIDPTDPNRCMECGKIFKNHFTVRTHYTNVHLRLMHKCTVPGCNAAFPSVRSRDRHSANGNLHNKPGASQGDELSVNVMLPPVVSSPPGAVAPAVTFPVPEP